MDSEVKMIEKNRICSVYKERDKCSVRNRWFEPYIVEQTIDKYSNLIKVLHASYGSDLSEITVLDVGCGDGSFLRSMIDLGCPAEHLVGTEFLKDRIAFAKKSSPAGIKWHIGSLDELGNDISEFDLVVANTVFSSILDEDMRVSLAADMWKRVKPGGCVLIFDFRVNNPGNPNVRKVLRGEMDSWWPCSQKLSFNSLVLAPPLARRLTSVSVLGARLLASLFPFLRTHFYYMIKKEAK